MRQKGLFFTMAAILLVVPIILLIAYYSTIAQTKTEDTVSKIRCDELHYFVEDIRSDLERALVIFGRRAAIYAINDVVTSGRPLKDYQFNCSSACHVDCDRFVFGVNGSEAAVAELTLCGTLESENIEYMTNHTLAQWVDRISSHGRDMHFIVNISIDQITIVPRDAWSFVTYTNATFNVYDESGTCYYVGDDVQTSSSTSIIGLEDPLFPLNTNSYVVKFIENCTTSLRTQAFAGCSGTADEPGVGQATGTVVFDSKIGDAQDYCLNTPPEVINQQILVLDKGFGSCNQYDGACFNVSNPNHFAGVLDYGPNSPGSFVRKCNVTIPWMRDTGDIDNITPRSPPRSVSSCGEADIYNASCVRMINDAGCGIHAIMLGCSSEAINTTCYQTSNDTGVCGGFDAPSFFDRIDGNLYMDPKYCNQSLAYFATKDIGLETLVNPYYLDTHSIPVKQNASWVDYLYWNGTYGCQAQGVCESDRFTFRLDTTHAKAFLVDTVCANVTGCGSSSEVCVNDKDEDQDGLPDWLDYDCISYFSGCGAMQACDFGETDVCSTCDAPSPPGLAENSSVHCLHYGYNTTEWHFYSFTPSQDGLMIVIFNGTSNGTNNQKTDLAIYNYSVDGGCGGHVAHTYNMENNSLTNYCVLAGGTYLLGLDVDAPSFSYNGVYDLGVYLSPSDPLCPTASTTSSTSSTSSTTSSSTTTTTICGFEDNMDSAAGGWTADGSGTWTRGSPSWGSCHAGQCYGYRMNGQYKNDANASLTSRAINLSVAGSPSLKFWVKYDIEYSDKGFVEAFNGTGWEKLIFYNNTPGWPTERSQSAWLEQTFPLALKYKRGDFRVRYRLWSDSSARANGMFVDDVNVTCN